MRITLLLFGMIIGTTSLAADSLRGLIDEKNLLVVNACQTAACVDKWRAAREISEPPDLMVSAERRYSIERSTESDRLLLEAVPKNRTEFAAIYAITEPDVDQELRKSFNAFLNSLVDLSLRKPSNENLLSLLRLFYVSDGEVAAYVADRLDEVAMKAPDEIRNACLAVPEKLRRRACRQEWMIRKKL